MPPKSLTIAQVTPYAWESGHEVNHAIAQTSALLAQRGHRVVILGPAASGDAVRRAGRVLREARDRPDVVFESTGGVPVLAVGETFGSVTTGRGRAVPVDVTRTIEELFALVDFDICHVHDPWAPSVASAALRVSPALNVGTFHTPTERAITAQMARKLVQLVFGRLDARIASYETTAHLMERFFPASYETVLPAAEATVIGPKRREGAPLRIAFVDAEERAALRLFLRALRRLGTDVPWTATVVSSRGPSASTPLPPAVAERIRFVPDGEEAVLAAADVFVAAAETSPAPGMVLRAIAAGAVPVVSRVAVYQELTADGERGALFMPRDGVTLAEQLRRLAAGPTELEQLRAAADGLREALTWTRVTDELEAAYAKVGGRRHATEGDPALAARLVKRRIVEVDLHMHTDHSSDCATPVEVLLATARDQGLGAIAVTDHNEITGALDAAAKAADYGVKVIVGEEVKTASQGEVIGLFLTEKIPRGLTLQETVAEIHRQGGLVYVPHPFDRMHSVPDYEHLLAILDDIDAMEIYNPRVAIGSFNEEAERFARKYRIVAGAGSDSHVAKGLGTVRIRMRDFDGPEEFLESLRSAEIVTQTGTLLYVQALKFLETTALPAASRARRRERRVRKASRKA